MRVTGGSRDILCGNSLARPDDAGREKVDYLNAEHGSDSVEVIQVDRLNAAQPIADP
jgi:hypothetical protein